MIVAFIGGYSGSRSIWIGTRPFTAVTRGLDPRIVRSQARSVQGGASPLQV